MSVFRGLCPQYSTRPKNGSGLPINLRYRSLVAQHQGHRQGSPQQFPRLPEPTPGEAALAPVGDDYVGVTEQAPSKEEISPLPGRLRQRTRMVATSPGFSRVPRRHLGRLVSGVSGRYRAAGWNRGGGKSRTRPRPAVLLKKAGLLHCQQPR